MNESKLKWILVGIFGFFLLMSIGAAVIWVSTKTRNDLPVIGVVTPFQFTERSGASFSEKNFGGKISVVNFFFTTCQGPCPRMNGQVAELYKFYNEAPQVQFVSISVDPGRDTLEALRAYAQRFGVTDDRWNFLRAPYEDVQKLSEKVFLLPQDEPAMHSTKLALVDGYGQIRGYYDSSEPAAIQMLKTHIRQLAKELK